jgi:NADPH-dependent 2,4-dienoyl-CoA reductase/sulfur reductase-like enzyme
VARRRLSGSDLHLHASIIRYTPANRRAIVGAGIAGLSAALESARAGHQLLVVGMSTVGGGHAIVSNGDRVPRF